APEHTDTARTQGLTSSTKRSSSRSVEPTKHIEDRPLRNCPRAFPAVQLDWLRRFTPPVFATVSPARPREGGNLVAGRPQRRCRRTRLRHSRDASRDRPKHHPLMVHRRSLTFIETANWRGEAGPSEYRAMTASGAKRTLQGSLAAGRHQR